MSVTFLDPQRFAAGPAGILAQAVLWLHAPTYSGSGNWLNLGTAGAALDAVASGSPTFNTDHFTLNGTSQYFEVPDDPLLDFAANESFTVLCVAAQATYTASRIMVAKKNTSGSGDSGYYIRNDATTPALVQVQINGTVNGEKTVTSVASRADGARTAAVLLRNVTADTLGAGVGGSVTTSNDTTGGTGPTNALPLRIGRFSGAATSYCAMDVYDVAVWRTNLSTANLAAIAAYLGA